MILEKGKKVFLIIGSVLLPVLAAGAIFVGSANTINASRADGPNSTLNNTQRPTLSGGAGTMVDSKNVTWEYYHAVDNPSGHIGLQHEGYFGVASNSQWGYTSITKVTVNYTAGSAGELWLLKSANGEDWHEVAMLKKANDTTSTTAESEDTDIWRYIRFYFYDAAGNETINIESVHIAYNCDSNLSGTDQIDCATLTNVFATDGLDPSEEKSKLSPNSIAGDKALRFTKQSGANSTTLTIKLKKTYTLGEVANKKIEFDIWTERVDYGKRIWLMNTSNSSSIADATASSGLHVDNPYEIYVWTALGNNWYHVELPFTKFYTNISGLDGKDLPQKSIANKQFDAIKINAGTCVIDNLRIGTSPCELGNYNDFVTYPPAAGSTLWFKTSFAGIIHPNECNFTFNGTARAQQILASDDRTNNNSPFYVQYLASGSLTITVNVVCSYDHRTISLSKTLTVN